MNLLKSTDPAPSKLSYKLNRLFYKLWFKLLFIMILLVLSGVFAKKFLYKNIDLTAEIKFLSEEGSELYKDLTELSISRIVVKGAQTPLKEEIIMLIKNMASEEFSALKAQSLREKIKEIKKVKEAIVKFSTDGLVMVNVVERKKAAVFLDNNLYQVLDSNGVILSENSDYEGLSRFPLIVGKSGSKNIADLLTLVNEIGLYETDVLYYEWVGERRWNVHMKSNLVFKLPENNIKRGVELMLIFLRETDKYPEPLVSIDLRNLDKPTMKFRKSPSIEYIHKKTVRLSG
ncbi:cell division protein FtsQ/DivIB [Paracoccaceae bacterium]|nr:cell division protein FtsQ/DivIB [Paracoccaceae bacterium]